MAPPRPHFRGNRLRHKPIFGMKSHGGVWFLIILIIIILGILFKVFWVSIGVLLGLGILSQIIKKLRGKNSQNLQTPDS